MKLSISMTRRETLLGGSYLLISMFVLPFVFEFVRRLFAEPLSDTEVNLIYFGLNFLCVAGIFWRFLRRSLVAAIRDLWRCLQFTLMGFGWYYLSMHLLSWIIHLIYPAFANVNDMAISQMTGEYYPLLVVATVFLVPVTEETLYRGLLFQGLQNKGRLVAYGVSSFVFAAIHVMGYIGLYDHLTLLLCFVQYLPAGIALAWSYEKADTIFTPILIHMIINQLGMSALR